MSAPRVPQHVKQDPEAGEASLGMVDARPYPKTSQKDQITEIVLNKLDQRRRKPMIWDLTNPSGGLISQKRCIY